MQNRTNVFGVLKRPVISEKSNQTREELGKYSFLVRLDATKTEIKSAISKVFNVQVTSVRTVVCRGKIKRRGMHLTVPKKFKKAIVTLAEGQKIKIFEDQ
jgi:large subunit ribosomal protein L23